MVERKKGRTGCRRSVVLSYFPVVFPSSSPAAAAREAPPMALRLVPADENSLPGSPEDRRPQPLFSAQVNCHASKKRT